VIISHNSISSTEGSQFCAGRLVCRRAKKKVSYWDNTYRRELRHISAWLPIHVPKSVFLHFGLSAVTRVMTVEISAVYGIH
jgi:hypothetical protein